MESAEVDVHGNSLRFLHADPATDPGVGGIQVFDSANARIARNVVRALPTAGDATPVLRTGIVVRGSGQDASADLIANRVFYTGTGIRLFNHGGSLLRDNRVRRTLVTGIDLELADDARIIENIVRGGQGEGIHVHEDSTDNRMRGNDFRNHGELDCLDETGFDTVLDNTWTDNLGADSDPSGILRGALRCLGRPQSSSSTIIQLPGESGPSSK